MVQRVQHGEVRLRRARLLEALPVANPHRRKTAGLLHERIAERGLARAPFAFDEHEPAVGRLGAREDLAETREVGAMIDEDGRDRLPITAGRGQRRVRDRRKEGVASTGFAADELRIPRIVGQRAAQFTDQHLDVLRLDVRVGPDASENLLVRHQLATCLDKAGEDIGGFSRYLDLTSASPERPARRVKPIRQKVFHAALTEGTAAKLYGETGHVIHKT